VAKIKDSIALLKPEQRIYSVTNPVIGLTGGIGSGKSTVSKLLMSKGLIVINADNLVHEIYKEDKTISYLKKLAPQMVENDTINFSQLRKLFFENSLLKSALENYLYQELPRFFKAKLPKKTTTPVIYDVPLLFEKSLDQKVDLSVVISCSEELQIKRVLKRDDTDEETTRKIISNQMQMEEKKKRASYNIPHDNDLEALKTETSKFFDLYFLS
jgi:dephospho-CoA kinase